jgi:hypothetical protein
MKTFLKYAQYIFLPALFVLNFIKSLHIVNAFKNAVIITKNDIRSHNRVWDARIKGVDVNQEAVKRFLAR